MADEPGRAEFAAIMIALDLGTMGKAPSATPSREGTPSQLDVWYQQMKDLPAPAIKAAVERFLCEASGKDQWPTIGVLRRYATEHIHGLPMTPDAAWEAVRAVLKKWSIYRSREENAAIVATLPEPARSVATRMGWKELSEARDLMSYRKSFCIEYAAAAERYSRQRALPAKVRPRIDGAKPLPIEHKPAPKALPAPPVDGAKLDKAKLLRVFREVEPSGPLSEAETAKRKAEQIAALKARMGDKPAE